MTRRLMTLGAVVVALAVLYVAAWQTQPRAATTTSAPVSQADASVAVTSVTRICPPPGPGTGQGHIAVVAAPGQKAATGSAGTGAAALTAIPQAGAKPPAKPSGKSAAAPVSVTTPGALTVSAAPQPASYGATAVSATGQMAAGFDAEVATSSGMGVASCTHPQADMWFVGTGAAAGAPTSQVYLANTGAMAATVEVTLITDAGVQQGPKSALTIGPDQFQWVSLVPYVRGSVVMAVHVETSSGQVAAGVWQSGGSGGSWLPQAAEPSTQLVIPGLTSASSAAHLFVVVPGAADAHVKVKALTSHGPFQPFGPDPEDAPAAASSAFALTSLGASAASLVLTSNVPITAGVSVPGSGIGEFSAASAPITQQGVIAGNPASGGAAVTIVLSAPAGAASATVSALPSAAGGAAGQASPQVVQVPAGHSVAVAVRAPKGGQPFAVTVTPAPNSGPLYAARIVTQGGPTGPVVSILPVSSDLTQVALPPARDSYTAILP